MASWSVATVDAAGEEAYARLVAAAPASPLSHTLLWREALRQLGVGEPVYWLALREGAVRAALPAFVCRSARGAVLNSLPFVQSTGGIISAPDVGPAERAEAGRLLVETMLEHCRREAIDVACIVGSPYRGDEDAATFPQPADFQMVRVTNVLDLQAPFAPRSSIQWTVRKAERFAPRHRVAATLGEARVVHDLYAAGMRALGVAAHPWVLFERLFVGPPGARFVWAEVDGQPVSALILLLHGSVVDYYCVGTSDAGRRLQTASWLCQREIEAARERGQRWWNWGVSPSPAVHDFKKRWGGQDRPYPIWGFCPGDVSAWHRLSPSTLAAEFPAYFVLPYDRLAPPGREGVS
jgi:GNAT acetyltransferase-like protein